MKIIVGLGNIGKEYEHTRHNAGFLAADRVAGAFGFDAWHAEEKFEAETAAGIIAGEKVLLVKPSTYMNLSGRAVQKVMQFYKLTREELTVIHDDLDIPLGEYRVSCDSRSAGHKGVQSIIDHLGSQQFKRLRIGIKIPDRRTPTEKFVLGNFTREEETQLSAVIEASPLITEKELMK